MGRSLRERATVSYAEDAADDSDDSGRVIQRTNKRQTSRRGSADAEEPAGGPGRALRARGGRPSYK